MKWLLRMKILLLVMIGPMHKVNANTLAPWICFDLGDTVIQTKDMKKLRYYKGAKDYLTELKRKGFQIGLITNIPETFGQDYDQKLETLKKMINDGWVDKDVFDWNQFDQIILPLKNSEMKPAPTMFLKALNEAKGCPSAYISENEKEIIAAKSHGFASKLFNENDETLYVPTQEVEAFLKNEYGRKYPKECFDQVS